MMATMAIRTIGTRITEADFQRLQDIAAALGKSPAAILREALALYVEIALPLALLARGGEWNDKPGGEKTRPRAKTRGA